MVVNLQILFWHFRYENYIHNDISKFMNHFTLIKVYTIYSLEQKKASISINGEINHFSAWLQKLSLI